LPECLPFRQRFLNEVFGNKPQGDYILNWGIINVHILEYLMKNLILGIGLLMASSALAAPGLTVSGTELHYNGSKIFFSGMNLAWMDYNSDVGAAPLDENRWRKAVQDIRSAGGNAIRWWLFNNMSQSPIIDQTTHLVSGLPVNTIPNMQRALDIAEEYGVMVSMCLFSHNLMAIDQWGIYAGNKLDITANHRLFDDNGTQAFITNALIPVVSTIGNHPALMTWELFNEPEGMSDGWFTETETLQRIQKFSNKITAAIKANAPGTLVSTGAHTFSKINNWTDAALIAAGGEATGTLDFYQAHFYPEHQTSAENPFEHPASFWGHGKPIIIGEFWAAGWNKETYPAYKVPTMTPVQAYQYAIANGYAGAMSWQYISDNDMVAGSAVDHDYDASKPGMEAIWATDSSLIKIKDYTPVSTTGNGVMQVEFTNLASEASLERMRDFDLSSANSIQVDARVISGGSFSFRAVVKVGSGWQWFQVENSCAVAMSDTWTTCTFNFADFTPADPSYTWTPGQVKSILFQSFTNGFTGLVQFDNVRAGTTIIDDFDTEFDVWSIASNMNGGAAITEIQTIYTNGPTPVQSPKILGASNLIQLQDNILNLQTNQPRTLLSILDLQGRSIYSASLTLGYHQIDLNNLKSGLHTVQLIEGKNRSAQKILISH
jgi:hypothetical protein